MAESAPNRSLPAFGDEQVDPSLHAELESVYDAFIKSVRTRDLEGMLRVLKISKTDEETLRKEQSADGFVSFPNWLLSVYPNPLQTTFIALKRLGDEYAGFYVLSAPSWSEACLNLSLLKFEKIAGQWKLIYNSNEAGGVPLQSSGGKELRAEAMETMATNPLLRLERPERESVSDVQFIASELTADEISLKLELKRIIEGLHSALEKQDLEAFLSSIRLSREDEERLRERFSQLCGQILKGMPNPAQTDFVTLKTEGEKLVGYYDLAPYPHNPSFTFIYLRPFVKHGGRWKMLFSLDHELAMSLNAAKSDGDATSRALEVIDKADLLQLRWVVELFRKFIPQDSEEFLSSVECDKMALATKAVAHKNYSAAASYLEELADSGMSEAQSLLGLLYAEGNGLERDYTASMRLFRRAAAQGDADGLYYLGYSHLHGFGVEVDRVQALAYFILAADRGHIIATKGLDKGLAALDERGCAKAFELAKAFSIDSR